MNFSGEVGGVDVFLFLIAITLPIEFANLFEVVFAKVENYRCDSPDKVGIFLPLFFYLQPEEIFVYAARFVIFDWDYIEIGVFLQAIYCRDIKLYSLYGDFQ